MSIIGNPPVVFLDEPTAGLAPERRIEVWKTVEKLADRIAIMHRGRIIVNGTLEELKRLLPPVEVEYVEKQPSLEDVFLALVAGEEQA